MVSPTLRFTTPAGPDEGEYLVVAHSLGTSAVLWEDAPALEQSFRVIRWELPGHGQAPRAEDAFTIGELSDSIVDHLVSLGASNFLYAGVSIGGTVGLDLALRHPDRVRAAAIISAGAHVPAPDFWFERAASVRVEGTESLVAGSTERWFARSTRDQHPDAVERLIRALRATDDESYALASEALARYDVRDRLHEIQPPVLALWGECDVLVPEEKSSEVALGVQRGQLQAVPGAAHASPIEQPSDVANRLTAFFRAATR